MKQLLKYSLTIVLCFGLAQMFAQKFSEAKKASKNGHHVLAVKIAAQVQNHKSKEKYADFLIVEYPLAIEEIETALNDLPDAPLGYDELADLSANWVDMFAALKDIPTTIKGKESSVTTKFVDYNGKHKEFTAKAIDQNYAAGEKLLAAELIADKDIAIKHFIRVNELNGNKNFKESNKNIVILAISAANDTLASGTEINEKIACIPYFETAEKYGYKESWKSKIAEVYYVEGKTKIESTTKFKSQVKAIDKYFTEAHKYENPYKDIDEISAKVYYDAAESYSQVKPNYKKMAKADELYGKAIEYKPDYKDVKEKKAFAHLKKNVRLFIIDVDGTCTSNSTLIKYLPEYFIVEKAEGTFPDSESLKKLAGKNAVVIKLADNIDVKYNHSPLAKTSKTVTKYYALSDKGKWICSTKLLNDESIKAKTLKPSEVSTRTGKKTSEKESATITSIFSMELWDVRNDSPVLLKTKPLSTSKTFKYQVDTYEGADLAPCSVVLQNKRTKIPTEAQAQKYKVDNIAEAFKMMKSIEKFAKFIDKKTKYQ